MSRLRKVLLTAFIGALVGLVLGFFGHLSLRPVHVQIPPPHHRPWQAGGTSLRFAMVHDTLHQRFFKHSKAYFEERNKASLAAMEKETPEGAESGPPSIEYFDHMDNLGVGYEKLGRYDEAIETMRDKLALQADIENLWRQQTMNSSRQEGELPPEEYSLYKTYANLGTFIVHKQLFSRAADPANRAGAMREALGHIKIAIEINPGAHFGREDWQQIIMEFMIQVQQRPELLLKYDMVGNRLNVMPEEQEPFQDGWVERQRSRGVFFPRNWPRDLEWITLVGAEGQWSSDVNSVHNEPVPFDEPVLGMIGMWMLGGGANPHFSLALAETMLRVGRHELAWKAYRRALDTSGRFTPDDDTRKRFVIHCDERQEHLEKRIAEASNETAAAVRERLEGEFQKNLAEGIAYQNALAEYEESQIKAGVSIDDPAFYEPFKNEHGSIATPVGDEGEVEHTASPTSRAINAFPATIFYAGLGSMLGVFLTRRRRTSTTQP
jgi:tetratricopeptide (TPR) repeat protein